MGTCSREVTILYEQSRNSDNEGWFVLFYMWQQQLARNSSFFLQTTDFCLQLILYFTNCFKSKYDQPTVRPVYDQQTTRQSFQHLPSTREWENSLRNLFCHAHTRQLGCVGAQVFARCIQAVDINPRVNLIQASLY